MAGDRLTVCERDCFRCPYPDCILDDADISLGEWAESTARDKRLQAAERSDREKKVAACKAAYYQANKEKIAAYQAAYRQANAVARCYRAPYHTYGRVKAYLDEFGKLPPAGYRLPRYKWQEKPRRGTRCRSCRHWSAETVCPMLLELQAAGLRGSVVQCSEYAKKNKRRTG